MNIGEARRVIEIEPVVVPAPGNLPLAERAAKLEPDRGLDRRATPWERAPVSA